MLSSKCEIIKLSPFYETEPFGYSNQGWFLNCVLAVKTNLNPQDMLIFTQLVEKKLGKIIICENGPRCIDIDILLFEKQIINQKNLQIPHPRMHQRNTVLLPFNDIDPNVIHPVLKKSISQLLNNLKDDHKWR